jgi:excisionase family DNA binding protein
MASERAHAQPSSSVRARTQTQLPQLLDLPGVAERLGTSERHVRRLVLERRIPYIKVGHFVRFDPADIGEWLDGARVAPAYHNPMPGVAAEAWQQR